MLKGIGALYVRTESALLAVGLGAAFTLAMDLESIVRIRTLRDRLWAMLQEEFGDGVVPNGHQHHRLPNTLNVSFVGVSGAEVLADLDGVRRLDRFGVPLWSNSLRS